MKARLHSSAIEALEPRIAPAAVFVSPTTATYTDEDGDVVTVKFTKPVLTETNIGTILVTSASGDGDRLDAINLVGFPAGAGTGISVTARIAGNGDGLANVGRVVSDADLGTVTIRGDLAEIDAGDAVTTTAALKSLTVQSFGLAAFLAGDAPARSDISGPLGKMQVKTDFVGAQLFVGDGGIGTLEILGTLAGTSTAKSGYVEASGLIGTVKVVGSIVGQATDSGQIVSTVGNIGKVTVGGSIQGGTGENAGGISADGNIGSIKIGRDLKGGPAASTGQIFAGGTLGAVTIGGSVLGGAGSVSGAITANGNIGPVKITGDLRGGGTTTATVDSGQIFSYNGSIASVTIGGDAVAAFGDFTGSILAGENIGAVKIVGDIYSVGDAEFIIRAQGTANKPLAIASLTVTGGVKDALVLAGYGFNNAPVSGSASVGPVKVSGNWIASSIAAGVQNSAFPDFATVNDELIGDPEIVGKITSIVIGGQVAGTFGDTDQYGFSAGQIGKVTIGGTAIPLSSIDFDHRPLGLTGDFHIHEVPRVM